MRPPSSPPPSSLGRSPHAVRTAGNHLTRERSLYLQQHAHNPIDWHPWGPEALRRALDEDKPVFLSIGYSSCHWCHVMECEVFEHDDIAAFMNEHFVCIKVDREERPDLDAVYMVAVHLLSGGGGWPMSVFLTPRLHPFFAGTYFPHDAFLALAHKISEVYRKRRDDVEEQAGEIARAIAADTSSRRSGRLDPNLAHSAARSGHELVDPRFGGFRSRMKFPTPLRWSFLLHDYRLHGGAQIESLIRQSLHAMQDGGLRDHVGGGFHRYTVDPDWTVPHFEKMLYDNAQMACLYFEAAAVFPNDSFGETARDTLAFMLRDLLCEGGGFAASIDADSAGREGSFYVFTRDELLNVAGPDDGPVLAQLLGASDDGNFEGSNVLTRRTEPDAVAKLFHRDVDDVRTMFERWRTALLEHRARRTPPGTDRKVVTSWNGLALSALAQGYALLGDDALLQAARHTAAWLWSSHRLPDGTLVRATNRGFPAGEGVLDDYAFVAAGLLDLLEASGDFGYLTQAKALVDHAVHGFSHPDGGFFFTAASTHAPLGRKSLAYDAVEPSGQSVLLHAMLKLASLTGDSTYDDLAREALEAHAGRVASLGLEMAWWADAALLVTAPSCTLVIAGDDADPRARALARCALTLRAPHVAIARVPAGGPTPNTSSIAPITAGKTARDGVPTAYVCRKGACNEPVQTEAELRRQLLEGWTA